MDLNGGSSRTRMFHCGHAVSAVRCVAVVAVFACFGSAEAAPTYRSDRDYPDLGLRIRVLGDSEPEPLAQCRIYTYELRRGSESLKLNMFDPHELWYAGQHAGQWRDKAGNRFILGRPSCFPPEFKQKHVPRDEFDKAVLSPACSFDQSDEQALARWIQAFTGCVPGDAERAQKRYLNFRLADAIFYPVPDPNMLICAFRVKSRNRAGRAETSDWFCSVLKIADGTPMSKARGDFEAEFLANVGNAAGSGAGAADVRPKEITVPSARRAGGNESATDSPGRAAALKSIANMQDWWFAETAEYIFLSDIRSAPGRALVRDLQSDIPSLRRAFAVLVPPIETSSGTSVVRIYEDRDAYKRYVGKEMEWSSGAWIPARRELVILSQQNDRDRTLTIVKHEGFHQYLFHACGMTPNAAWFDEGHAALFESSNVDRAGHVDLVEGDRCSYLMTRLDAASAAIPKVIAMDHAAFYAGSNDQRALNYSTAWGLAYYLHKGAPARKQSAYAEIIPAYLSALEATRDPGKATAAAFSGTDMAVFQKDFLDFWKRWRHTARRHNPFR